MIPEVPQPTPSPVDRLVYRLGLWLRRTLDAALVVVCVLALIVGLIVLGMVALDLAAGAVERVASWL